MAKSNGWSCSSIALLVLATAVLVESANRGACHGGRSALELYPSFFRTEAEQARIEQQYRSLVRRKAISIPKFPPFRPPFPPNRPVQVRPGPRPPPPTSKPLPRTVRPQFPVRRPPTPSPRPPPRRPPPKSRPLPRTARPGFSFRRPSTPRPRPPRSATELRFNENADVLSGYSMREKRNAGLDWVHHSCCRSYGFQARPESPLNMEGLVVDVVQLHDEGQFQYFHQEHCQQNPSCSQCQCDQPEPFIYEAVVDSYNPHTDWIQLPGCCKCLNAAFPG